jgi:hypothetical protein
MEHNANKKPTESQNFERDGSIIEKWDVGQSIGEIAKSIGITNSTVSGTLGRNKDKLKRPFGKARKPYLG